MKDYPTIQWLRQNFFQLIGILTVVANFYMATIVKDAVNPIAHRVEAMEKVVKTIPETYQRKDLYQEQYKTLCEKLDNLTTKLDKLTDSINRLYANR